MTQKKSKRKAGTPDHRNLRVLLGDAHDRMLSATSDLQNLLDAFDNRAVSEVRPSDLTTMADDLEKALRILRSVSSQMYN